MDWLINIIGIIIITNIGFLFGVWWKAHDIKKKCAGYLNIDHSIPNELNFFADLDLPPEEIATRMYVIFRVKNVKYLEDKDAGNNQK